jgi:hypothetical protein
MSPMASLLVRVSMPTRFIVPDAKQARPAGERAPIRTLVPAGETAAGVICVIPQRYPMMAGWLRMTQQKGRPSRDGPGVAPPTATTDQPREAPPPRSRDRRFAFARGHRNRNSSHRNRARSPSTRTILRSIADTVASPIVQLSWSPRYLNWNSGRGEYMARLEQRNAYLSLSTS